MQIHLHFLHSIDLLIVTSKLKIDKNHIMKMLYNTYHILQQTKYNSLPKLDYYLQWVLQS